MGYNEGGGKGGYGQREFHKAICSDVVVAHEDQAAGKRHLDADAVDLQQARAAKHDCARDGVDA